MTRVCSLLALFIGVTVTLPASPPTFAFATRDDLTTGSDATTAVVSADFNGDGIVDLAVSGSTGVSIFLGEGGGRFHALPTIRILSGSNSYSYLVAADINVDGIPDLVLFDGFNAGRTLFGKGDGTFTIGPSFSEQPTNAGHQVFVADFNRDGKPDLALGTESGVTLLFGHGDGTFSAPTLIPVADSRCFAIGDVNGDGDPDVIACGFDLEVFLGKGDGTFRASTKVSTPSQPVFLTIGDINADGNLDLAAVASSDVGTNPNLGPIYVLFGNGDGSFQPTIQIHSDVGALFAVAIGDVNGDGLPDIVAGGEFGLIATILNEGSGSFKLDSVSPITFGATYQDTLLVTDLNGDQRPDLVASNSGGYFFSILFNQGGKRFKDVIDIPLSSFPGAAGIGQNNLTPLAQADFNGDGYVDFAFLATQQNGTMTVSSYLGTGKIDEHFLKGPQTAIASGASSIAAGDFNNDGKPDVAVCFCNNQAGILAIYLGNGDGTFTYKASLDVTSANYMIVSDWNNDGVADIALSSGFLLLGKGDGTFNPQTQFYAAGNASYGGWLGAADFNHDGKMDIAFFPPEIGFQPLLQIFLGNGDGTFNDSFAYIVGGDPEWGDIADFNEDGIPDLVIWNSDGGGIQPQDAAAILIGVGDGSFAGPTYVQGDKTMFPNMVMARDWNGDGHADLAVLAGGDYGFYLGGSTSIFLFAGNGDGTFQKQQQIPGAQGMSAMASGYFHGQKGHGFPDFLTFDSVPNSFYPAGTSVSAISVLLNVGASH